jgi:hypothetical protein
MFFIDLRDRIAAEDPGEAGVETIGWIKPVLRH